ncbi:heat stress transcription factor A-1b [Jatropha curcas]|uniref:heat stress transcription factor A-1b n=1 Tax=Jatropha curcas TaxID=180498 RepID=UPI0018961225|nr:heat stress transcription factor A-1b [Jatropha curcas]
MVINPDCAIIMAKSSLVEQGFRKVDPDRCEFANEGFLRGQKHLLKSTSRKKPLQIHSNQPPLVQSSKVPAVIEVGKFGLEEEVERLKRDKNVLMQELVRLRQQQQATDNQLQTVGQRVQVMEQRQQQMMSFLAKAMQSPGFLNQLVHQNNESKRPITGGTKKRRLPGQVEENLASKVGNSPPNGPIVKFHSSMNEAAKAMVHQILKMNSSSRLEPSINNSGPFLIGNLPSSNALDSSNTSSRISELMLPEVPPASGPSSFPIDSGFSVSHTSDAISEVESSSCAVSDLNMDHLSEMRVNNSVQDTVLPNFNRREAIVPESAIGIPNTNFVGSEIESKEKISPLSSVLDMEMPVEVPTDAIFPNQDTEILVDGIPKLPGINDVFWEQFLTASPVTGDTDESNSNSPQSRMNWEQELQPWEEDGWDNILNMNHLPEQMELLASAGTRG